jgi:predicted nuclease of predicted toxin-antitoxin system
MLRLVSDENFHADIVRGLLRRRADLDLVRNQDVGLQAASDPAILECAAGEGRIVLTHDRATLPSYAFDRVRARQTMPGVFVLANSIPVRQAIDEILLINDCTEQHEWSSKVVYLPL